VLLYVGAAVAVWWVMRLGAAALDGHERWVWRVLFVVLVVLGINKQLDLQSALTEWGRITAYRQGWYESREQVQQAFIAGMAILGVTLLAALLVLAWGTHPAALSALGGGFLLLVFVVIRAASFHQVDRLLHAGLAGLRFNWVIEMGALAWIVASAWRRRPDA
jgi:hypothetical protein